MDWQKFFQSKRFIWIITGLAAVIVLLLVFQLGMFVGFHKAEFSFGWGDNYHRNFGGTREGLLNNFEGKDFISGHGTAGSIAKIDGNTLVIKSQEGKEKTINITATTTIKDGNADIKVPDLKTDESIVVIGAPQSDGSINAEIIRVFDPTQAPPPRGFQLPFFN